MCLDIGSLMVDLSLFVAKYQDYIFVGGYILYIGYNTIDIIDVSAVFI